MLQLQHILICTFIKFVFGAPLTEFKAIGPNSPVMLKLDADEVLENLKIVMNSQFVRQIADDIAAKAVQHIVREINANEGGESLKTKIKQSLKSRQFDETPIEKVLNKKYTIKSSQEYKPVAPLPKRKIKTILDEKVALALLREPNPDGDNLEIDSLEFTTKMTSHVPMKINGVYMRRLNEKLKPVAFLTESFDTDTDE